MIITCPCKKKQFKIDSSLIPNGGRELQCGSCERVWFYETQNESKDPLLITSANTAAIKSIIPEDASNLKNCLNGLVICWIIVTIYFYSAYLSIAKKA